MGPRGMGTIGLQLILQNEGIHDILEGQIDGKYKDLTALTSNLELTSYTIAHMVHDSASHPP